MAETTTPNGPGFGTMTPMGAGSSESLKASDEALSSSHSHGEGSPSLVGVSVAPPMDIEGGGFGVENGGGFSASSTALAHAQPPTTPLMGKSGKDEMNVYINNLPPQIDSHALRLIMCAYGDFESCTVVLDRQTGESRGYGFVQFSAKEAADAAIRRLHNCNIHGGKPLICRIAIPLSARQDIKNVLSGTHSAGRPYNTSVNLYIRNLPHNFTPESLRDIFAPHGEITSLKVINDGKKLGIGFVRYPTLEMAEAAIKNVAGTRPLPSFTLPIQVELADKNNPAIIEAAQPSCRPTRPKKKPQDILPPAYTVVQPQMIPQLQTTTVMPQQATTVMVPQHVAVQGKSEDANIYLSGFPTTWEDSDLVKNFSQYGEIISVRVMRMQTGESKSIGFVRFRSMESAFRAINATNHTQIDGKPITCRIAHARYGGRAGEFLGGLANLPATHSRRRQIPTTTTQPTLAPSGYGPMRTQRTYTMTETSPYSMVSTKPRARTQPGVAVTYGYASPSATTTQSELPPGIMVPQVGTEHLQAVAPQYVTSEYHR